MKDSNGFTPDAVFLALGMVLFIMFLIIVRYGTPLDRCLMIIPPFC